MGESPDPPQKNDGFIGCLCSDVQVSTGEESPDQKDAVVECCCSSDAQVATGGNVESKDQAIECFCTTNAEVATEEETCEERCALCESGRTLFLEDDSPPLECACGSTLEATCICADVVQCDCSPRKKECIEQAQQAPSMQTACVCNPTALLSNVQKPPVAKVVEEEPTKAEDGLNCTVCDPKEECNVETPEEEPKPEEPPQPAEEPKPVEEPQPEPAADDQKDCVCDPNAMSAADAGGARQTQTCTDTKPGDTQTAGEGTAAEDTQTDGAPSGTQLDGKPAADVSRVDDAKPSAASIKVEDTAAKPGAEGTKVQDSKPSAASIKVEDAAQKPGGEGTKPQDAKPSAASINREPGSEGPKPQDAKPSAASINREHGSEGPKPQDAKPSAASIKAQDTTPAAAVKVEDAKGGSEGPTTGVPATKSQDKTPANATPTETSGAEGTTAEDAKGGTEGAAAGGKTGGPQDAKPATPAAEGTDAENAEGGPDGKPGQAAGAEGAQQPDGAKTDAEGAPTEDAEGTKPEGAEVGDAGIKTEGAPTERLKGHKCGCDMDTVGTEEPGGAKALPEDAGDEVDRAHEWDPNQDVSCTKKTPACKCDPEQPPSRSESKSKNATTGVQYEKTPPKDLTLRGCCSCPSCICALLDDEEEDDVDDDRLSGL